MMWLMHTWHFTTHFLFAEEDSYGSYARQLSKYFLAEGVVSGHAIFLASAEPEPSYILKVIGNWTVIELQEPYCNSQALTA